MKSTDTTNLEKLAKGIKKINPNSPLLKTVRKRYTEVKDAENPDKDILLPVSPKAVF